MKRILAMCLVLVLILVIALPAAVLADTTGTAGVNGDVAPTPSLASISITSGTPNASTGGVVDISETLTGSNFDSAANVTVTISGVGVTADNVTVASDTSITATFHLAAGPATTSGARDVYVHQSGRDSTETVVFSVGGYITITAPSPIDMGVMTVGSTNTGSSNTPGTVETNDASTSVTAKDSKTNNAGYMDTVGDGSGNLLTDKFQIGKNGSAYAAADTGISYTNPSSIPLFVSQQVVSGDTAGSYQITITFTGSAN